jgi:hypothetical protein
MLYKKMRTIKLHVLLFIGTICIIPHTVFAFKQRFHEDITENILKSNGFDEDSADQVGDANWYTDIFEPHVDAAHVDNNSFSEASGRLEDKREAIANALGSCERREALNEFGRGLHTVQDVFSHSNSIDNGHSINDLLSMSGGTATCTLSNFAPGGLVSGYFNLGAFLAVKTQPPFSDIGQCIGRPIGVCCHLDLNKDDPDAANGIRHGQALDAARTGTEKYLSLVEDKIRESFPEPKSTQLLKMFKRKQRSVYFVIDDTGSMSDDIDGIQSAANSFLDEIIAGDEIPKLGLVSFKDSPNDRGISCDIEQLRNDINGLIASGGDDCPEASNSAMLQALANFPANDLSDMQVQGGRLILATDASAGDANLGPTVAVEAQAKRVSIDAILTGDCVEETEAAARMASASAIFSSNNPAEVWSIMPAAGPTIGSAISSDPLTSPSSRTQLRALTQITGGVLFNVERIEVGQVVPTLLELSKPETAVIFNRTMTLTAGSPVEYEVPIDNTLNTSVTFMVTATQAGALPSFSLIRPDGTTVDDSDISVTRQTLSSVDSYVIKTPTIGIWKLRFEGAGGFAVRVFGPTLFQLNSVSLQIRQNVNKTTRPEVDFLPLTGQPVVGDSIVADLRLTSAPQTTTATLRRPDGSLIEVLNLEAIDGVRRYRANLTVPNESFIIEVQGITATGIAFVRDVTIPSIPQKVAIELDPSSSTVRPGSDAVIKVKIKNVSATAATYNIKALSSLGWVTSGPASAVAPANGFTEVNYTVQVPASATEGTLNKVTFLTEDVATPRNRNNASASIFAGALNQPPVCTSATVEPSILWPPTHKLTPVSIKGITDPDGDTINLTIHTIMQDEPVIGSAETANQCKKTPDGSGIGTASASVRSDRDEKGDGRMYEIGFTVSDGRGENCAGKVQVSVPRQTNKPAVTSGQRYDATVLSVPSSKPCL